MRKFTRIKVNRLKHGYKIKCKMCSHEWNPRLKTPVVCPRCNQRL